MPIRLDIKPYCVDCPHFEADVDKDISTPTGHDIESINVGYIIISCAYKDECALKMRYLENQIKNKEIIDDFVKRSEEYLEEVK